MTFTPEEMKILEDVPAGKKQELIQFAQFLIDSQSGHAKDERVKPVRQGGWVKGEIWMSEDFNDPLEFVSDSEMRVLDAMREPRQEVAV